MISKGQIRAVSLLALLFLILLFFPKPGPSSSTRDLIFNNGQQNRWMQALYQVEARAASEGWTAENLSLAADLWTEMGDLTQALPYLEAMDSPDQHRLAETYLTLQRWSPAADLLEQMARNAPGDAWIHYHVGLLRAAFDPRAAQADLQIAAQDVEYHNVAAELLRIVSRSDDLLAMHVGLSLAAAEMWPYAELAFQHAADTGEAYAEGMAYVSLARDQQGKDGGAWIERAVNAEPQNAVVRYLQGLHLRQQGIWRAAAMPWYGPSGWTLPIQLTTPNSARLIACWAIWTMLSAG